MTDITSSQSAPKPPPAIVRWLKGIALLRESWVGTVGGLIVLGFVLMAIFAPLIAPYDPNLPIAPFVEPLSSNPEGSEFFLLGTDHQGRDILSRIIFGGQRVLFYATLATLCAYVVGIIMGLYAGYYRGWVDEVISFVANVILSFPVMVLYVLIIAKLGASGANIVIAVVFASSPGIMRIVRGLTLDIATREYVTAAETRGESTFFICMVEILPNARGPSDRRFLSAHGLHDDHHRRARLPGPRPAAAGSGLGRHDHRNPRLHHRRLPAHGDHPRRWRCRSGARLQHAG